MTRSEVTESLKAYLSGVPGEKIQEEITTITFIYL